MPAKKDKVSPKSKIEKTEEALIPQAEVPTAPVQKKTVLKKKKTAPKKKQPVLEDEKEIAYQAHVTVPGKKWSMTYVSFAIAIVLVIGGSVAAYLNQDKLFGSKEEASTAQAAEADSDQTLVQKVSKHIQIPSGAIPKIGKITDVTKLQSNPAFANARDGDRVLFFGNKVIIYDEVKDIVIDVAQYNPDAKTADAKQQKSEVLGDSTTAKTTDETKKEDTEAKAKATEAKIKVEIRNASGKTGAAKTWATKVGATEGYEVAGTGNSSRGTVVKSEIINLKGVDIAPLEEIIGATAVKDLPEKEKASTADVLVIIGKE